MPRARHRGVRPDPPEGLDRVRRRGAARAGRVRDARRRHDRWSSAAAPGAPSDPLPDRPGLGGRQRSTSTSASGGRRVAGAAVAGDRGHRRRARLVLVAAGAGPCAAVLDRLVGGVGLRRGRRDPRPAAGRRRARLLAGRGDRPAAPAAAAGRDAAARSGLAGDGGPAEPTTAGRRASGSGRCSTRAGCSARSYWWGVSPFHGIVFGGMARNIARAAEARAEPDARLSA